MRKSYNILKTFSLGSVRYEKGATAVFHPRRAEFLVHGGFIEPQDTLKPKKSKPKQEVKP